MACRTNTNKAGRAAVFAGTPPTTARAIAAFSAVGAAWGAANAVSSGQPVWRAVGAIGALGNTINLVDAMLRLRARKKLFTKHVLLDRDGAEIGWSYDPAAARRRLNAYQDRGAFIVPVQEKVDVATARQQLVSRRFQPVESRPDGEDCH